MADVLIYTSGDRDHGMGHVVRTSVLAEELERRDVSVCFVTPRHTPGHDWLVRGLFDANPDALSLGRGIERSRVLIVDVENGPTREFLASVRNRFRAVIVIGGVGYPIIDESGLCLADLVIRQSFSGESDNRTIAGVENIMIDSSYRSRRAYRHGNIVISMGGGDKYNLTELALEHMTNINRPVVVVVGPAKPWKEPRGRGDVRVVVSPRSLVRVLDGAALCICTTGMTAYEAACVGVPSILVNISDDHEETARAIAMTGAAINIGGRDQFGKAPVIATAKAILEDEARWVRMSSAGRQLVDGRGVKRVVDRIVTMIEEHVH